MRYLSDRGAYDDHTIKLAETLFERFVGRVLAVQLYDERIPIRNHRGRLSHSPVVEVVKASARVDQSSVVPWSLEDALPDVDVDFEGNVNAPASMFGDPYDSAHFTYLAGYESIPADVATVVAEIARLVSERTMDEWSGEQALSDESRATIARYRR